MLVVFVVNLLNNLKPLLVRLSVIVQEYPGTHKNVLVQTLEDHRLVIFKIVMVSLPLVLLPVTVIVLLYVNGERQFLIVLVHVPLLQLLLTVPQLEIRRMVKPNEVVIRRIVLIAIPK